jgi:hypothetical protein
MDLNDEFKCSCINCGCNNNLQMIALRNKTGKMVGWVFVCTDCADAVGGKNLIFQPAVDKDKT